MANNATELDGNSTKEKRERDEKNGDEKSVFNLTKCYLRFRHFRMTKMRMQIEHAA